MDVATVYNTTKFSIKSLLKTYKLDEIQLQGFDKWRMLQQDLENIKMTQDYFHALSLAEIAIENARTFIKNKSKELYNGEI